MENDSFPTQSQYNKTFSVVKYWLNFMFKLGNDLALLIILIGTF